MKSITDAKDAGGFIRQLHIVTVKVPAPKAKGKARRRTSQAQAADAEALDEHHLAESSGATSHDGAIHLRKSTRSVRVKPNYAEEDDGGEDGSSSPTDDGSSWGSPSTSTGLLAAVGTEQDATPPVPATPKSAISTPLSALTDLSPESPLPAVSAPKSRAPKTPSAARSKHARSTGNKTPGSSLKRTYSTSLEQEGDNDATPPNDSSDSSSQPLASSSTNVATKKSKKRARN
ncbi:uncharacterized protein LOC62_02G002229 [Vanrija pseudolonga]|uniref:Uncharacterized protein n=1 Tax=Vanrija pseudolonga TaxID=143232 RepID=A0AAF1BIF4_9TREE|nr:hypothetical protein LOC62_02G002229 [Vanrija pseudolonga]